MNHGRAWTHPVGPTIETLPGGRSPFNRAEGQDCRRPLPGNRKGTRGTHRVQWPRNHPEELRVLARRRSANRPSGTVAMPGSMRRPQMSKAANSGGAIPSRSQLFFSTREWSPLEDVALAVSVATENVSRLYVARLDEEYRWSLIHRGGPYPLLRITARFLEVDHQSIFIGFESVGDGYSALCEDPEIERKPSASAILSFDGPTPKTDAERLIREALG